MRLYAGAFITTLLMSGVLQAATPRQSGGADPQLQMRLQQVTLERNQLSQRNTEIQTELEELQETVKELESAQRKTNKKLTQSQQSNSAKDNQIAAYDQQNQTLRGRLEELSGRYRELAEVLREVDGRRNELTSMAQDYESRVTLCEQNNGSLHTMVGELVDRYERKGVFKALRQKDPFVGLSRVKAENMMDDYRYLADKMRLEYPELAMSSEGTDVESAVSSETKDGATPDAVDPAINNDSEDD